MFRKKKEAVSKILPLSSKSAATVFKTIKLDRVNPSQELTSADLENCLAQATWKFFDALRVEAGSKLGVDENDMLLADARIIGMKIDGHRVINPEGFTGKHIEFTLCLTLVRRDSLPDEDQGGAVFEEGIVRAHLISKHEALEELIYIESDDESTYVFQVTPTRSSYLASFDWGKRDLLRALTTELGTDNELGEELYLRYVGGEVSPRVMRRFNEIFYNNFGTFTNGIAMAIQNYDRSIKKAPGSLKVYIRSFSLPQSLWEKRLDVGNMKVRLQSAPQVNLEDFVDDKINDSNQQLNRLAKQRIKWLMAR